MNAFMKAAMVVTVAFCGSAASAQITIDTVHVGNPGNAGDSAWWPDGPYGAVAYEYDIGTFEVKTSEYVAFLNAVAKTDTYALYNTQMWSNQWGCKIQRTGSSGSYSYSVAADRSNRPVNYVSWGDAVRFANWMHNGQPVGAQGPGTTEDGAYALNGAVSAEDLLLIVRDPSATWVLASQDEWYKAAYHKNDGVTSNYWLYATQSDDLPSNFLGDPDLGNNANWRPNGNYSIGSPYFCTPGGEFENSESPYGTFDQTGNVWEWTEGLQEGARGMFGGCWNSMQDIELLSGYLSGDSPASQNSMWGFRLARVTPPCPADFNHDGFVNGDDYDSFASLFESGEAGADFNHDGFVNGDDYDIFASHFEAGC
ncbi:MAG: SUMF1/EgtB/PvdO family nonheme iron enzyme [Phycisphaerales bacterium]|nr:SUMF1/EgtB/PvdO family nonheme iron enzyme [Phycisphaerales bacterium]